MGNLEWYVEVSDGVKRKTPPEMIKVSELREWQARHQSSTQGLFSSICMYPTDDPYIGGVLSDFYVDFDFEENPDKARKEAISVVKKLTQDYGIPEENIRIAFSGMKGISITVSHNVFNAMSSAYLLLIWKGIVQELILELNLKTADTSVYERRRLWRLLNSRHQKSGLYKIPLTLAELENLTIDKIKKMADKPRELGISEQAQPVAKARELFEKHKNKVEKWLEERKKAFEKTELRTLTDDPPCVRRRLEIGAKAGSRNSFLFQLAVYYAHKGLGEPEIVKIGYEFAKRCEQEPEPFPKPGEVESIVGSAFKGAQDARYGVGCSSEVLAELCDKANCLFFKKPEEKGLKHSCGEDLPDKVFEQTSDGEFLVYDKVTGEVKKEKSIGEFKPYEKIIWKPVDKATDYKSEQELWSEVKRFIYEHMDVSEGYDVLTAWVLMSWVPERWKAVPYLFFFGPKGSGKSRALEILGAIGFRPFLTGSATLAAIFRLIEMWHITLFLDETEIYMKKDYRDVQNLLNTGYRRGWPTVRVEENREGERIPVQFDTFGPKALAGTKELLDTLKSRCVVFGMSKAIRDIRDEIDEEWAQSLREKLLMYRFRILAKKELSEKPKLFKGRLRELFDPLIIVAPLTEKNPIIQQAKKIEGDLKEEEEMSLESIVFKAIMKVYQETQEEKLLISDISKIVNEKLEVDEMVTNITVGMTAKRLGFQKCLRGGARAIRWNKELAERLIMRYGGVESQKLLGAKRFRKGVTEWLDWGAE